MELPHFDTKPIIKTSFCLFSGVTMRMRCDCHLNFSSRCQTACVRGKDSGASCGRKRLRHRTMSMNLGVGFPFAFATGSEEDF